jgi:hypothetical protein
MRTGAYNPGGGGGNMEGCGALGFGAGFVGDAGWAGVSGVGVADNGPGHWARAPGGFVG